MLSEIDTGGGLDAIGAITEIRGVQVFGEDLRRLPLLGEVERKRGLAQLLENRPVALLLEGVLYELLGDRRGALGRAPAHIRDEGADDPLDIDSGICPEALVLDRHDRVAHVGRDAAEVDDHGVGRRREDADHVSVVVV